MEYEDFEMEDRVQNPETDRYAEAFSKYGLNVDEKSVSKSVELIRKNIGTASEKDLKFMLSCLDYTSLKATDSDESILQMTEKINCFFDSHPDITPFAAICVYPCYAETVSKSLEIEDIAVACVSGGFPSSQTPTEIKIAETAMAVHDGADEIDIVMPVGRFMSGEYEYIADEMQELKSVCGEKTMKVILETGALENLTEVKKAAIMAMYCGADFIKTSTGKEAVGATPEAFFVMCQAIKEYAGENDRKIGIKAAGGISTVEDALVYVEIARQVLGKDWMNPSLFRIGASRLAGKIITSLTGEEYSFQ